MSKLSRAIAETKEYLQLNSDPDCTDYDAIDHLTDECGKDASGVCVHFSIDEKPSPTRRG